MSYSFGTRPYKSFDPERYAIGIALLSMDLLEPLQDCLCLTPIVLKSIRPALRGAIAENRTKFAKQPSIDPNLRSFVAFELQKECGSEMLLQVERWLDFRFIRGPDDYRRYSLLRDMLETPALWDRIGVPNRLRVGLVAKLRTKPETDCLYERYNDDYSELSDWDLVIFARSRFYHEHRDPFTYLNLTCAWLRFRRTLKLLLAQTDENERSELYRRSVEVALNTGRLLEVEEIMPIEQIVADDA